MKKKWTVVLAFSLLGCSQTPASATVTPSDTPSETAMPTEDTTLYYDRIRQATASYVEKVKNGETVSLNASSGMPSIENAILGNVKEIIPMMEDDRIGAYVDFDNDVRWAIRYDEDLNIIDDAFGAIPAQYEAEAGDGYQETVLHIGKAPQITAVLTTPIAKTAPVVIIVGETDYDDVNASENDGTFKSELAHLLAQNGVASLRYEMRNHQLSNLLYLNDESYALDRSYGWDFAAAVHALEDLPVDHTDYSVLAVGDNTAWTAGYTADHYEVKGGLILVNMPEKTGIDYQAQKLGLDDDTVQQLKDYVFKAADDEILYGLPASEWQLWETHSIINGLSSTQAPILLIQGELDGDETAWNTWLQRYNGQRRLTMKAYEDLDRHFRDEDGHMDKKTVEAIAGWIKTGRLDD